MAKRIVISGDNKGGHFYSLVEIARFIKQAYGKEEDIQISYLGPYSDFYGDLLLAENIEKTKLPLSYKSKLPLIDFLFSFCKALRKLFIVMPDIVFVKGGTATLPVVFAARILLIPVLLHESDAEPGVSSKIAGSFVDRIILAFARAKLYYPPSKTVYLGNPIKKEAINGSREKGKKLLSIKKVVKPLILVLGGSAGSKQINDQILNNLEDLMKKYQIIHQTGIENYEMAVYRAQKKGFKIGRSDYYPVPYASKELAHYYELADGVISKAGSMTISELAANRKPAILIPITREEKNFQRINAFEVAKEGGAIVLEEDNFKKGMLLHYLDKIINDLRLRNKLIKGMVKFYNPKATEAIASEVMRLAE